MFNLKNGIMSDYEKHIGKLKIVDLSEFNNDIEKFFESECRKMFVDKTEDKIQKMYQNAVNYTYRRSKGPWQYLFEGMWYDYHDEEHKYYAVNGVVYELIEDKEVDGLCYLKHSGDGTFNYVTEFYNGDTCLYECIEHMLENLNITKN
jgi:hypothetical protein